MVDRSSPVSFPLSLISSSPNLCLHFPDDLSVARTCNVRSSLALLARKALNLPSFSSQLIFIVLDVLKPLGDLAIIQAELEGFGIRLNKQPPQITVKKKERGGVRAISSAGAHPTAALMYFFPQISLTNTVPLTNIDADEIKAVLSEYRLNSCDVAIRQPNATLEDLIDVIEGNRVYIPGEMFLRCRRRHVAEAFSSLCSTLRPEQDRRHLHRGAGRTFLLSSLLRLLSRDACLIAFPPSVQLLYRVPMSVPISSTEWLNIDELTEVSPSASFEFLTPLS